MINDILVLVYKVKRKKEKHSEKQQQQQQTTTKTGKNLHARPKLDANTRDVKSKFHNDVFSNAGIDAINPSCRNFPLGSL